MCLGDAGGFAGRAIAVAGDVVRGRQLLDDALARNRATGCVPAAARVQAALDLLPFDGPA
jgi:hypothetical protein